MMYEVPHKNFIYFYNSRLNLVTTECMHDPETRRTFEAQYHSGTVKQSETVVYDDVAITVDHEMEAFARDKFESGSYFEFSS
jgi:hypothetical protein